MSSGSRLTIMITVGCALTLILGDLMAVVLHRRRGALKRDLGRAGGVR